MHAALATNSVARHESTPQLRVYDESTEDRVGEIVELLRDDYLPGVTVYGQRQADFEQERRKLRHAVELLRTARLHLHDQFQRHELEQQRLLGAIREEWRNRRRQLERQLAVIALQKAREEVADEREQQRYEARRELSHLVEEQQQLRDQLLLEHEQFDAERQLETEEQQRLTESLQRDATEWDQRKAAADQQVRDLQRKLVEAELTIVKDRTEWTEQRRQWHDERQTAERIIQELLAELDEVKQGDAQAA